MSAAHNTTSEIQARRRAATRLCNVITLIGLLVIGFPLIPQMIKLMLVSCVLTVVTGIQFVFTRSLTRLQRIPAVSRNDQPVNDRNVWRTQRT
jgi:putative exporter of polyketide antibiotics